MISKKAKGRVAISLAVKPIDLTQRIFLAAPLGYLVSMEMSALLGHILSPLIDRSEAAVFSAMISFLVYLLVIIWVFIDRKLSRLWATLSGGGIILFLVNTKFFV